MPAVALALVESAVDPFALVHAVKRMRAAGFTLSVAEADALVVVPASRLTAAQRAYISADKVSLFGGRLLVGQQLKRGADGCNSIWQIYAALFI